MGLKNINIIRDDNCIVDTKSGALNAMIFQISSPDPAVDPGAIDLVLKRVGHASAIIHKYPRI